MLLLGLVAIELTASMLDEVFCDAIHALLGGHEFGSGGRVTLAPSARGAELGAERSASWTVALTLRVDGVREAQSLVLNPRRMLWLPWLVAVTATVGLAEGPVRAAWQGLFASVVVMLWTVLCVWCTAVWVFASVPGLVYTLGPMTHALLNAAYEGLVGPPTARYLAGLVAAIAAHALGLALESRQWKPRASAAAGRTP